MRNAPGDGVAQARHDQNAVYCAVVSDLVTLAEHVQNSLRLIEHTIARETSLETSLETSPETSPGGPESSTNVIVLDDVSPRYLKAAAALQACDINLGIALRSLVDSSDNDPCAASLPALSVIVALGPTRRRSRWSVRCYSAANFSPVFRARSATCCDRGLASGMPQRRRPRMPPRRWRNSTPRSTI